MLAALLLVLLAAPVLPQEEDPQESVLTDDTPLEDDFNVSIVPS